MVILPKVCLIIGVYYPILDKITLNYTKLLVFTVIYGNY